jgi:hypothetical protein
VTCPYRQRGVDRDLLGEVTERRVLTEHDGRSGATIERVRLRDGQQLVVKTLVPSKDITCVIDPGAADRELRMFESGVLAQLPDAVGHAVVGGWREDGRVVIVMRDVGEAMITWQSRLAAGDCRRVVEAITGLHRRFAGLATAGLVPLERWLVMLSPSTMGRAPQGQHGLPAAVARGWERFRELAPPHVADAVSAVHAQPAALATALREHGTTLAHGDLWPVNVALPADGPVILVDWSLAVDAPGAVDLIPFIAGAASLADLTRDELVALYATVSGTDQATVDRSLFAGLAMYGWNKALDAAEHPDPATRARELADLVWWVERAHVALERSPWPLR